MNIAKAHSRYSQQTMILLMPLNSYRVIENIRPQLKIKPLLAYPLAQCITLTSWGYKHLYLSWL